jgi:Bacterial Ig-like domain
VSRSYVVEQEVPEGMQRPSCSIQDKVGNPLAADYSWSFTTTDDITAPWVTEYSPTGWGDVSRDTYVTVKFSKNVDKNAVTLDTFMLATGTSEPMLDTRIKLGTTVTPTGQTATLDPYGTSDSRLVQCARSTAKVTSGVTDKAGNPGAETVWTFKTRGS